MRLNQMPCSSRPGHAHTTSLSAPPRQLAWTALRGGLVVGGGKGFGEGGEKAPTAGKAMTATAGLPGPDLGRSNDDEVPARLPSSNGFAFEMERAPVRRVRCILGGDLTRQTRTCRTLSTTQPRPLDTCLAPLAATRDAVCFAGSDCGEAHLERRVVKPRGVSIGAPYIHSQAAAPPEMERVPVRIVP